MVDDNEDYGDDDPKTLGSAIWLAVLDGECSVEEAVAARRGQETPEETAVLRAICGPSDTPASIPISLHPAQTRRGTGRGRAIGGMVALLAAAAACLLWAMRPPEPRGELVANCTDVVSQLAGEKHIVASLEFEVRNGQPVHLGAPTPQETIAFVEGETLVLRGTTSAAASPSVKDIEVRLGDSVLLCEENKVELALPNFTWRCALTVQTSTPAGKLPLRVCARNACRVDACNHIANLVLQKGVP